MRLICKCYGHEFEASTMQAAKRSASRIANGHYKAVDVLHVIEVESGISATFLRVNKVSPNNTIVRGIWA